MASHAFMDDKPSPMVNMSQLIEVYRPSYFQNFHKEQLQKLIQSFKSEVIFSLSGSLLLDDQNDIFRVDTIENMEENTATMKFSKYDRKVSCPSSMSSDEGNSDGSIIELFRMAQNDIIPFNRTTTFLSLAWNNESSYHVKLPPLRSKHSLLPNYASSKRMLIVYTTNNQLSRTIQSLQYMRFPSHLADLIIVDDHSVDGTVEYLQKKGFAVITKPKAMGLTDSWNIGYRFAVTMGYSFVLYVNSGVLLTSRSAHLLYAALQKHALVLPLTTDKGAGSNPVQSVRNALRLKDNLNPYIEDHTQANSVQFILERQFGSVKKDHVGTTCKLMPSVYKGKTKFTGSSFGVNIGLISPIAIEKNNILFDPKSNALDQEIRLPARMKKLNMLPMVAYCSFLYHFVTEANPVSQFDLNNFDTMSTSQFLDNGNRSRSLENLRGRSGLFEESHLNQSDQRKYIEICRGEMPFPQTSLWTTHSSSSFLPSFREKISSDVITSQFCVYPTHWSSRCSDLFTPMSDPKMKSVLQPRIESNKLIVIAIAMSDPSKTPLAEDIFIAYEIGQALRANYRNIHIRYLRRGVQWYAMENLYDVDVLISLLDSFDLTKILPLFQTAPKINQMSISSSFSKRNATEDNSTGFLLELHTKPSLVTIAWTRNWFHRWLMRPWIGNYDLVLTSSMLSKAFFDQMSYSVGFPLHCSVHCPRKGSHSTLFNKRAVLETAVFPLATSIHETAKSRIERRAVEYLLNHRAARLFHKHAPKEHYMNISAWAAHLFDDVDYIFSGSYQGQWRSIMSFDPTAVPLWKGRVVGDGWSAASNMSSWASITIGRLPHEMIKEAYKFVKIVIDDADQGTEPWGSVNSKVFDALAAGALVISNGAMGLHELFGEALESAGLPLPIYSSGRDLAASLEYYLSNEDIRLRLVEVMRKLNLVPKPKASSKSAQDHEQPHPITPEFTDTDAGDAAQILEDFVHSVNSSLLVGAMKPGASSSRNPVEVVKSDESRSNICIGIRTMRSQQEWLDIFVKSLLVQHQRSAWKSRVDMKIFLVDTESNSTFQSSLFTLADRLNEESKEAVVEVLVSEGMNSTNFKNPFYGYDSTDRLLRFMLMRRQLHEMMRGPEDREPVTHTTGGRTRKRRLLRRSMNLASHPSPCEWIMFTNGDNMYNAAWFDKVAPGMVNDQIDMIGWDFITHHLRGDRNKSPNVPITMDLRRGHVDLASVMVRADLYRKTGTLFLPDAMLTKDLYARDFLTIQQLSKHIRRRSVFIIHQCLLFHQ
eukprot:scaffold1962_cov180-Ochromonas_danica.AAC.16